MKIQIIGFTKPTADRITSLLNESLHFPLEISIQPFNYTETTTLPSAETDVILIGYHDTAAAVAYMHMAMQKKCHPLFVFAGMSFQFEDSGTLLQEAKVIHLNLYADYEKLTEILRQKHAELNASFPL